MKILLGVALVMIFYLLLGIYSRLEKNTDESSRGEEEPIPKLPPDYKSIKKKLIWDRKSQTFKEE